MFTGILQERNKKWLKRKTLKKSILEFGDEMQSSNEEELRNMRMIVKSSRKKKTPCGDSFVSFNDKKKGKVKHCTQFEIELANIFQGLKDKNFPKKEIVSFTDMLLDLICHWKELEKKFLDEELIKESSFVKEPGGGPDSKPIAPPHPAG